MKLNSDGDSLWSKEYDFRNSNSFRSIQQMPDGGFIAVGTVIYPPVGTFFDYRVVLLRTDANGDSLWTKEFTGLGLCNASHVEVGSNGDISVLSTTTDQNTGETYFYLLKTDSTGSLITSLPENNFSRLHTGPNPANDKIYLTGNEDLKKLNIKITSLSGKVISELFSNESRINIATDLFADGVYLLQISSAEKLLEVKKFVVLHRKN